MRKQVLLQQWGQILRSFYLKEANSICTQNHRNPATGVFLIIFENIFLVLCGLLRHSNSDLENLDSNLYYGIHQVKSAFSLSSDYLRILVAGVMGINILTLGLIVSLIFFYLREQKEKYYLENQESYYKGDSIKKEYFFDNTKDLLESLMRLISCCYRQIIFPVGIFVSFLDFSDPLGPITLFFTFLLGLGISDCDFSYIHFSKDYLAKPYHSIRHFLLILEVFTLLSFAWFNQTTFLIILWIFLSLKFFAEIFIAPYWKKQARWVNAWVLLLCLGATSIFFLGFNVLNTDDISISLILIVIDLPFSVVVSIALIRFEEYRLNIQFQEIMKEGEEEQQSRININNLAVKSKRLEILDLIVRNNLFQTGDSLKKQDKYAISLFSALPYEKWANNISNSNQSYSQGIDNSQIISTRQELINRIASKFEAESRMREQKQGFHLYLSFLLYIQNNYRLFWLISQKLKKNEGVPIKNQQFIQSICQQFKGYKRNLEERISRNALIDDPTQQTKSKGSSLYRQSMNPFYRGFLRVIEFEEHINLSYQLISQASKLKLELLETMKKRQIDSDQLSGQIDVLEERLTKIRQNILQAYLINPKSAQVADLQVIFMKSLAFTSDERVLKRERSSGQGSGKFAEELSQYSGDLKIFQKNQCVIFTVLEDQFELKIVQVSVNFKRLFRYEAQDILNQPTSRLMSAKINHMHHQYVKSYLTQTDIQRAMDNDFKWAIDGTNLDKQHNKSNNTSNISNSEDFLARMKDRQIFAVLKSDRSNFIIAPVQVETKLNTSNQDQLGFSARLRVLNNGLDYILFSANNLQTLGVTENIFRQLEKVNSDFCSSIEKFNMKQLFPFLVTIQELNTLQGNITSTMTNTTHQWAELYKNNSSSNTFSQIFIIMFTKSNYSSKNTKHFSTKQQQQQYKKTESQIVKQMTPSTINNIHNNNNSNLEITNTNIPSNFIPSSNFESHTNILNPETHRNSSININYSSFQISSTHNFFQAAAIARDNPKTKKTKKNQQQPNTQINKELEVIQKNESFNLQYQNSGNASKNTTIIDQSNQSTFQDNLTSLPDPNNNNNNSQKSDPVRCVIFSVDIQLINLNYQNLPDLFAVQISRIRKVKQGESFSEIQNHIQEYYETYSRFYSQEQLSLLFPAGQYHKQITNASGNSKEDNQFKIISRLPTAPITSNDEISLQDQHQFSSTNNYDHNNNNNINNQNTFQLLSLQSHDNLNIDEEKQLKLPTIDFDTRNHILNSSFNNGAHQGGLSTFKIPLSPSSLNQTSDSRLFENKSHQQVNDSNYELNKNPNIISSPSPMSMNRTDYLMSEEFKKKEDLWTQNTKKLAGQIKKDKQILNASEQSQQQQQQQYPYFNKIASKNQNSLTGINKSSMKQKNSKVSFPVNQTTDDTPKSANNIQITQQQLITSPMNTQRMLLHNTVTIQEETEQAEQVSAISRIQQQLFQTKRHLSSRQPTQSSNLSQIFNREEKDIKNQDIKEYQISDSQDEDNDNNNNHNQNDRFEDESDQENDENEDNEDNEDNLDENMPKHIDLHAEIESHRSKASSTASISQLKNYVKLLSGREKSQAILVINYIGYLCYFIMVGLTIITYTEVDNYLTSSFYDNSYSVWPMKYSWILSNLFINQNMQLLISQGDVNSYPSLPTAAAKTAFLTETHTEGPQILDSWKHLLADSFRIGRTRGIFQYYMENYNVVMYQQLYNKTTIKGSSSVPSGVTVYQRNETVLNSGPLMMSMLTRYIGGFVENTEYYVTTNAMNVVGSLKMILTSIADQFEYSNSFIKSNQVQLMIVVIVISFFCLLSLIPLYAFIQFRRDKIIELFSTFSLLEIESMAQQIYQSLQNSRNMMKSIKNLPQITQKTADPKRQPLGTMSTLPKISLPLIAIAIIGYVLILLGPITNNILTQNYIEQTQFLLYNKRRINEIRAHSQNILQINYQCLILKIRPSSKLVPLSLYMSKMTAQLGKIQYYTDFLTLIIKDQDNLMKIDKDFHNFFFAAIEGNICKAFSDYPQYITDKAKSMMPACMTIHSGILQQGFSISMRTYYTLFPTLSAFYNLKTAADTASALAQINTYLDIKDFNDFNVFLQEVIETLSSFFVLQYQNKFDFIRNFQLGIMIYQLVLLSLIFLLGWWKFASHLNFQFARTQQQLRVLNINALVENNYVIAYFKKHHKT